MRILLAEANRTIEGGAETYLRELIGALDGGGQEPAFLCERLAADGAGTIDGATGIPVFSVAELGVQGALAKAVEWAPDVVYVQGLASPSLEAQLLDRWPGVLFAHGYYGTCETGTKRHAFPEIATCTRTFGPACLALHHARRCGGLGPTAMVRGYLRQAARRALLSRYRAICVASAHMRAEYLRHAIPEDHLHVLPLPPTGITRASHIPAERSPGTHLVLVSRLTALKGGDLLLDALPSAGRRLKVPLSLTVLGDGPERSSLEARARTRGVDARFMGWVDVAHRNRVLQTASLLVMPSLWPEPWGLAGLEAACLGVPTVAFAMGAIPEWLASGQSGELAPADPPSSEGLATAIVRALGDPAHYARLSHGAWERVQRYTIERHVQGLLRVLTAALA